jgi:hypothetical protein
MDRAVDLRCPARHSARAVHSCGSSHLANNPRSGISLRRDLSTREKALVVLLENGTRGHMLKVRALGRRAQHPQRANSRAKNRTMNRGGQKHVPKNRMLLRKWRALHFLVQFCPFKTIRSWQSQNGYQDSRPFSQASISNHRSKALISVIAQQNGRVASFKHTKRLRTLHHHASLIQMVPLLPPIKELQGGHNPAHGWQDLPVLGPLLLW